MHHNAFPICTVSGSYDPVAFSHLGRGAVPAKCAECKDLFEGGCTRAMDLVQAYLALDHGPCGVRGPTDPVVYEDRWMRSKVEVPRKCADCVHITVDSVRGFHCGKDPAIWGSFPRSLDWGAWRPGRGAVTLSSGHEVTSAFLEATRARKKMKAFMAFRAANKGTSIMDAKRAYTELVGKVGPDQT